MESTPKSLVKATALRAPVAPGMPRTWNRIALPFRPPSVELEARAEITGEVRLAVHGALTARTAVRFKQAVADMLAAPVLRLDLSELRRLDPTGLAALAEATELGRQKGCRVLVAHLPAGARRWIAQACLHKVIELSD